MHANLFDEGVLYLIVSNVRKEKLILILRVPFLLAASVGREAKENNFYFLCNPEPNFVALWVAEGAFGASRLPRSDQTSLPFALFRAQ